MFSNSSNVGIFGGTFLDQQYHTHTVTTESTMDRLLKASCPAAFYNSGERFDPPKCHPDTRTAVLKTLMDWLIVHVGWDMFVLWLYGPAGAGKSAIAQTFAETAAATNCLLASFFFSKSDSRRNNAKALAATLAYQVASTFEDCYAMIEFAINKDPLLLERSFETQFNKLFIEPLVQLAYTGLFVSTSIPYLVIIDGLDECLEPTSQRSILNTISNTLARNRILPLIFIVASRPEYHLTTAFSSLSLRNMTFKISLDDTFNPCTDIKKYFFDSFHDIRTTHILRDRIPKSWPTDENIDTLVKKSSGQFIYAATVIKYVASSRHNPVKRLQVIDGILPVNNDRPYAQLDALYTSILSGVENIDAALKVLGIHQATSEKRILNIKELETFMLLSSGDIQLLLIDLVSVVDVSEQSDPIRFLHASFIDFLYDQVRSLEYFIDSTMMHVEAARLCLRHINAFWRSDFNIAALSEYAMNYEERVLFFHIENGKMQSQELRQDILDGHYLECLPRTYSRRTARRTVSNSFPDGSDTVYYLEFLKHNSYYFTKTQDLYLHQRKVWDGMLLKALTTLRGSRELAFWTALYSAPQLIPGFILHDEVVKELSTPGEAAYLSYTPFILMYALGQGIETLVESTGAPGYHTISRQYKELMVEFFADPSRAGPYALGDSTYTMAAEFLLAFAVRPLDKSKIRISTYFLDSEMVLHFIWVILPTFLGQAGYSEWIIEVLESEMLTFVLTSPEKSPAQAMLRAAAEYLNKYTGRMPTKFQIVVVDDSSPYTFNLNTTSSTSIGI